MERLTNMGLVSFILFLSNLNEVCFTIGEVKLLCFPMESGNFEESILIVCFVH